jgi:hypothetical protein
MIVSDDCYDEEKRRKTEFFGGLAEQGMEIIYDPERDELFVDLNNTLTNRDLATLTLEYLDGDIADEAKEIMKMGVSEETKAVEIIHLIKNKTSNELEEAGMLAVRATEVPGYLTERLRMLKPSKLTIFTRLPEQVGRPYIEQKIRPLYGEDDKEAGSYIEPYFTLLEEKDGVLTGEIDFMPDRRFRDIYRDFIIK